MKHGVDAFSFVILEECPKELLNERETWWIAELGTLAPGGYNLTGGGGAATVVSAETRAKTSASLKGTTRSPETLAKMSASMKGKNKGKPSLLKGRTLSPETREKMSAAKLGNISTKGKTRSPEAIAASVEGRRRAKAARAAAAETSSYSEPLLEALQSLRTDKQYVAMDSGSTPPAGPPSVVAPSLEELEFLCGLL